MSAFDEMVNGRGGVRPQWRPLLGALASLDPAQLQARADRLERTAEEEGAAPTWRCDPVPLPISTAEFAELEQGLSQRARLLEALLQDLYGPQRMLAEGALPPALVFANPGFLRACRAMPMAPVQAGRFLQIYAADLVRAPDGRWRVLADRTGGAPGIGYARESRRLLARVMPELFRPIQVHQLRPFFDAWQDALLDLAPPLQGRMPLVALLTRGVSDTQWPEHLTLSRDLNCALVQARDLTVRNGALFLKTLRGLQQVDVLLRRVPGNTLDPLEAEGGAVGPGVTGLLNVARQGGVRILNHPGAAAVEAPALAAFLPALSRRLLGETLLLATNPTLWLGDEDSMRMACQAFQRWNIRSALDPARPPRNLPALPAGDRAMLEAAIAQRPWAYAACTAAEPSVAPCHGAVGLEARPIVLRMFLMHTGSGWRMMQGGVARVLDEGEHVTESLPEGSLIKDVWFLSEENRDIRGPEPVRLPPLAIRRSAGDLPSRVADDFYWLGRYVERLETQARLCRAGLLRRARGAPLPREVAELGILIACLDAVGLDTEASGGVLDTLVRDALVEQGALSRQLGRAWLLVESLRDRVTPETYSAFAHALRTAKSDLTLPPVGDGARIDAMVHAMGGLTRLATTVAGVAAESMVRGGGWLFLDLGRRMERAWLSSLMLSTVMEQPASRMEGTLRLVLELFDSAITYRSRYMSVLQPAAVLDLVVADTSNPRALCYQFTQAARLLREAGSPADGLDAAAISLAHGAEALVARVAGATDPQAETALLPEALMALASETAGLSDRISRRFFALLPQTQSIGLEVA